MKKEIKIAKVNILSMEIRLPVAKNCIVHQFRVDCSCFVISVVLHTAKGHVY